MEIENMRVQFIDLDFKDQHSPDGKYLGKTAEVEFGKYWMSIVPTEKSLPFSKKAFYSVAILDQMNNFVELPGIHYGGSELNRLTQDEVEGIMVKLACIQVVKETTRKLTRAEMADKVMDRLFGDGPPDDVQ